MQNENIKAIDIGCTVVQGSDGQTQTPR